VSLRLESRRRAGQPTKHAGSGIRLITTPARADRGSGCRSGIWTNAARTAAADSLHPTQGILSYITLTRSANYFDKVGQFYFTVFHVVGIFLGEGEGPNAFRALG